MHKIGQLHHKDKKLTRWTDDVSKSINEVVEKPILDGNLIQLFDMPDAADVSVPHLLGRKIQGWNVADLLDAVSTGRIERVENTGVSGDTHLSLKATGWGATIRVAIWVY